MATLAQASKKYLTFIELTKAKAWPTIVKETCALNGWNEFVGTTPLRKLTRDDLNEYAVARAEEGASNRTVNLDILALKNCLLFARDSGLIPADKPLVTDSWKPLKHTTPRRSLFPKSVLMDFIAESLRTEKHARGQFLCDYLRLLAFSGARKTAALTLKWENVDWRNEQVTFQSKFDKWIVVDMNRDLKGLLSDMELRRTPSPFVFPGEDDGHACDPHKTFHELRLAIGKPAITLHDFRHYFASNSVMSGVDLMTVASWLGHTDGGRLVQKVYGHLSTEFRKQSAGKVQFA